MKRVVFDETIRECGGEFSHTKASVSSGTCHLHLQCRGCRKGGSENFLNVCHVCTILLSEARDCQLAAECAHLHCDDESAKIVGTLCEMIVMLSRAKYSSVCSSCMYNLHLTLSAY